MSYHRFVFIAAVLCLGIVSTLWAGGLLDRDAQRLQQARENHASEVERAFNVYSTQVDRANERLDRIYDRLITQYENRGEADVVSRLRGELEQLKGSALRLPFPDDDEAADDEESAPSHVRLIESMGPVLINASRDRAPSRRVSDYDYIALYYTASWCAPCKRFTPRLIEFYNNHRSQGSWEIIVVSGDRSEMEFENYLRSARMPWAAVPFDRKDAMHALHSGGYPRIVVMDREGNTRVRSRLGAPDGEEQLFNEIRELLR